MKRTTKNWLIAAALLILAGGFVFCRAMAANHWDFSALGTAKYETNTVEIGEAFRNIAIRSDTADIVFLPSGDGECRVVFYEQEKVKHTAAVRDGTLVIDTADARKWYDYITLFSFASPRITVCLPQPEYGLLYIEEKTGDIAIPGDFTFEDADISAGTGDVYFSASASGRIRIKTSTGDIRVGGVSAGALELSVSTGRTEVRSAACQGAVSVTVTTGKAALTDVSCGSLTSSGTTGGITLENVTAAGTLRIERSTGSVAFRLCDAAELSVKTSTGSVSGSLLSEKVFIAQSGTGRVRVPETAAGGICRIETGTGNITITVP